METRTRRIRGIILIYLIINILLSNAQPTCKIDQNPACESNYIPSCECGVSLSLDYNKHCCCGRDYFFYSFPYADRNIIGFGYSNNIFASFCRSNDYDFVQLNSTSSTPAFTAVPGDWFTIMMILIMEL